MNRRDGTVCEVANNLTDTINDGDLWWRTLRPHGLMSYRVGYPEQEYNDWHSIRAGDRILAGAGADKNIGDLARGILARWDHQEIRENPI